ncbi:MAG TPA: acyltransferase [Cytophagales bacterium]|nr:acyltransferase [Cytophagales bacterium]
MKSKIFFPNLDGLRTLAFLAVFFVHSFYTTHEYIRDANIYAFVRAFFSNGMLGVNLFFVLSGFLITYLLLNEEEMKSEINLPNFYIRRFLRIWPLFFACVFYGFIVEPWIMKLFGEGVEQTADPLLYVTFLSNFSNINYGETEAQNLGILWSVSIEEQFYLFWPLLLLLFRRRIILCLLLILVSIVFRYFNAENFHILRWHTLSVIGDLSVGGLIGLLSFQSNAFVDFFKHLGKWKILMVYIAGFGFIFFKDDIMNTHTLIAISALIISLFFAFIILEQNYSDHSFFKLKNNKIISSMGKYTYGLYCLHMIGIAVAKEICTYLNINNTLFGVLFWQTLLSLTLSMLMSYVSYEFYEKPFLKLKGKFSFITR